MQKNKPSHRAWNLIRIAILWARKRRVFKKKLITELRLFPKFLKSLTVKHLNHPKAITYKEQQFSFDATPLINFKKLSPSSMRLKIPCIGKARVDFDYDFEYNFIDGNSDIDEARKSFLKDYYEDEADDNIDRDGEYNDDDGDNDDDDYLDSFEEMAASDDDVEDEKQIDVRAEYFIAQFYSEIKLQRQLSLRRKEMLNKNTS